MQSAGSKLRSGIGRISLASDGCDAVFTELVATYPLKLLSPRTHRRGVATVYLLTYGGGLVGGDQIELAVSVESDTILVLLSQGSTKVFKTRPGQRLASNRRASNLNTELGTIETTTQNLTFVISAQSALFLLPDPVTCFRSACYAQKQVFHLSGDASIVVLDWITSGRVSMGEEWAFYRYHSINEVWVDEKRIARDVMLLEDDLEGPAYQRGMKDKLWPYSCYAMVMLCGKLVAKTIEEVWEEYEGMSILRASRPVDMIWSVSEMRSGVIIKVAGAETETVRKWLGHVLKGLKVVVGTDVYRKAFAEGSD